MRRATRLAVPRRPGSAVLAAVRKLAGETVRSRGPRPTPPQARR